MDFWKNTHCKNPARWSRPAQAVGAFTLVPTLVFQGHPFMTEDLKSAAAIVTLDVGVYTVQVDSADDGVGEVLVEAYEITD